MLYASILMSLSSTHHCTGNAAKGDRLYAELYEEGIIGKCAQDLEWSKLATEREKAFIAMAYLECSLGHLMNDKYEEARKFARRGRKILLASDRFAHTTDGEQGPAPPYHPYWAERHYAWSLIGLGKDREAEEFLTAMLVRPGHSCNMQLGSWPTLNEALQYVILFPGYV